MNLYRIASRIAYDFRTKMQLNMFVIDSIARLVDPSASDSSLESVQNDVSTAIMESNIHQLIGQLADAMSDEVDKVKKLREKTA